MRPRKLVKIDSAQHDPMESEDVSVDLVKKHLSNAIIFLEGLRSELNKVIVERNSSIFASKQKISLLKVRALDDFDRQFGKSGISYLVYFLNAIQNKKNELHVEISYKNDTEPFKAFKLFFPKFPTSTELAECFRDNSGPLGESIARSADDARQAAVEKAAAEKAAAEKAAAEKVAAEKAAAEKAAAMAIYTSPPILDNPSEEVSPHELVKKWIKEYFLDPIAKVEEEMKELREKKKKAEEEAALKEKEQFEKDLETTRRKFKEQQEAEEQNRRPINSDLDEKHSDPSVGVAEVKHPQQPSNQLVLTELLGQAQAQLNPRVDPILQKVVVFLKKRVAQGIDEDLILDLLTHEKVLLGQKDIPDFLQRWKQTWEQVQRISVKKNQYEVIILLLEDIIKNIENEARFFEKRLAYLLEEANKLPENNILKDSLLKLHDELDKIKDKIEPEDLPTIMNVIKTVPIPVDGKPVTNEDLSQYKKALKEAEKTSLSKTPWSKTRIGLLCGGILGIAAGLTLIGFSVTSLILSHGMAAPVALGGIKLGWDLLIAGGAVVTAVGALMVGGAMLTPRNSLFSRAYDVGCYAKKSMPKDQKPEDSKKAFNLA